MNYELIKELCGIYAVSGNEYTGADAVSGIFSRFFDEVSSDGFGNTFGFLRCNKENAPLVVIDAHIDTIGLMVTKILDKGFLSFISVGGVDPSVLPACEVTVHGKKDIYGVIGAVPPHLLSSEDAKKGIRTEDLKIDTGYSRDELEKLVTVGDFIEFKRSFRELLGGRISCPGLDNRLGVYTSLLIAESFKPADFDVCFIASSGEEIGRRGVKNAVSRLDPSLFIIIDTTHGDTPDSKDDFTIPLGSGGAICKGPCLDRKFTQMLIETAEKEGIPYAVEVEGSDPGTNAWAAQVTGFGVPCVMASVPIRYMHTNAETASLYDAENCAGLIVSFLNGLKGGELLD